MYLFCMDMKRHKWNKLLGTIWEHIKKKRQEKGRGLGTCYT